MTTKTDMPLINIDALNLSESDTAIACGIVATQGKNAGRLRASAPKVAIVGTRQSKYGWQCNVYDRLDAETFYVWRMVAFHISPKAQHHCMPVTDDMYLSDDMDARRARAKELDVLVDTIVNSIPKEQWYGIRRWGQAYGVIGTPVVREGGTIVYR